MRTKGVSLSFKYSQHFYPEGFSSNLLESGISASLLKGRIYGQAGGALLLANIPEEYFKGLGRTGEQRSKISGCVRAGVKPVEQLRIGLEYGHLPYDALTAGFKYPPAEPNYLAVIPEISLKAGSLSLNIESQLRFRGGKFDRESSLSGAVKWSPGFAPISVEVGYSTWDNTRWLGVNLIK